MGKLCLIGTDNINKIIDRYYEKPKAGEPQYKKSEIMLHKHTLKWSIHEILVVAATANSSNAGTRCKVFFGLKTNNNVSGKMDKVFEIQLNSQEPFVLQEMTNGKRRIYM